MGRPITRQAVQFTNERTVTTDTTPLPNLQPNDLLVQTTVSAISAGTEMLVYRNQFPKALAVDATLAGMENAFSYPLEYGYASVGTVIDAGEAVQDWVGRRVFAFQPHATHFVVPADSVQPIPDHITNEDAVFLPNMETAVNLVQDGQPLLGERVAVFGQGIVGLLTTAILAQFPLTELITIDGIAKRRHASQAIGITHSTPPNTPIPACDLIFELSGNPNALNAAIESLTYQGRVVVGSWYGDKTAPLQLDGHFHRGRVEIISSQVSTIAPHLRGRWSKARRFDVAWAMLEKVNPSQWITHRFALSQAAEAYDLIDTHPDDVLQVVFVYPKN